MPRYIKYYTSFGSALQGVPDSALEATEVFATIWLAMDRRSPLNNISVDPMTKAAIAAVGYVYSDTMIVNSKPSPCTCGH
eukprot:m.72314 g.72314  ORF g.72314 m.72314 type:complete len:80 (+) comp10104_c0_seq2:64-303(+)